jgi:2-polyprenyl-3-methyl-5-hydroxy-6-metoxy-1,4-benzoquinol methylase
MNIFCFSLFFSAMTPHLIEEVRRSNESTFTDLYDHAVWGVNSQGEPHCGSGSTKESSSEYMIFLDKFLRKHEIKTIVEVGCGDWEFMQHMDLSGIQYLGIDVVKKMIDSNNRKFRTHAIAFMHADAAYTDLPQADLFLCKDVMQHLPNKDIFKICSQFNKFRYCLIVNDVNITEPSLNNLRLQRRVGYRPVDLTKQPFNLPAEIVLTYKVKGDPNHKQVVYLKN